MDEIHIEPELASTLNENRLVTLQESHPVGLYRAGEKIVFVEGDSCIDIANACSICGGQCCAQHVILSPLEVMEISDYTGLPSHEFCELVPAPWYAEAMRAYFGNYFFLDKGILATKLMPEERCVFVTETGCKLPHYVKPATCRLFPLNFEYDGDALLEEGADPSVVELYFADYSSYDSGCLLVTSFEKVDPDNMPMDDLCEAMAVEYRPMQLAAWKLAKSIAFWNEKVYPYIDGLDADGVLEVIRSAYDEQAIYGRILAELEAEWLGK